MKTLLSQIVFFSLCLFFVNTTATAQTTREAMVKIGKTQHNTIVADFPCSKDILEKAFNNKTEKEGLKKSKKVKDFRVFSEVNVPDISPDKMDLYYNLEGNDSKSTLFIAISKGYDNFISSTNNPEMIARVQDWINSINTEVKKVQLDIDIKKQEEVIKTAQKNYESAKDNTKKLMEQKSKIEEEIKKSEQEEQKLNTEVGVQQSKLESIKATVIN